MTPLLTEAELSSLYLGYRDAKYNERRLSFEPDYQYHLDQFSDVRSDYHRVRREFYDEFHAERFGEVGLVVDFSEGSGYFARYAYPRADVVVLPRVGVPPGIDLAKLLGSADVLMSTHALQAAPRPRETLGRLVGPLRPGATAWIEVPIDYRGSLKATFELLEARFARGVREFGPLQTLHESLAHFSVRSLRLVLASVGLVPTEFVRSSIGVLGVLAHKS